MRGLKKIRKYSFYLLWVLLVTIFLMTVAGFILINKYEEEIKELSIARINQTVETAISVGEIDVSFFPTFPYLSVVFEDVLISSSNNFNRKEFLESHAGPLFTADKVFLKFNVIDLIRSKIRIRRIYAVNGEMNVLIDSEGKTNARILKPDFHDEKNNKRHRVFELEALRIVDFDINFNNLSKKTSSSSRVENLLLKGKFASREFAVGTQTSFILHDFSRNGIRYANEFEVSLKLILDVKDKFATIQKGELSINTMRLDTKGTIKFGSEPSLNLMMDSRNINTAMLLSSFPDEWRKKLPFNVRGRGDLAVKIEGPITSVIVPEIKAVYVLNIDQVNFRKEEIRNLRLKGNYTNGKLQRPSTTEINIQKFRIQDRDSDFEGSFSIVNLVSPDISLNLAGELDAGQLMGLIMKDDRIALDGKLFPDIRLNTRASSLGDINRDNLGGAGIEGRIMVSDIDLSYRDNHHLEGINGQIGFSGERWYPELVFSYKGSKMNVKAQMDNALKYFMHHDRVLNITGFLKGDVLDLTPFLEKKSAGANDKEKTEKNQIRASIGFSFREIETGIFDAANVGGSIHYSEGAVTIPDISFSALDGNVDGSFAVSRDRNGNLYMKSRSDLEEINITKLFKAFDNFGQDNLRSENLKGFLSGDINFSAIFDSTSKLQKDQIFADADIKIRSGELNRWEPAEKLSRFVDIEELSNIRFSTLQNNILIQNNKMTIPEMDIKSNAFNIRASGTHNFKGPFDYKMKILLSEILTGKNRKQNEFYVMEDNRRASLYLNISGTADDYNIRYDRQEAISAVKNDLKKEKNDLKAILNEEFGWFGRDSLKDGNVKNSPGFVIEWDEGIEEKRDSSLKERSLREKRNDREEFILEWDEKDDW